MASETHSRFRGLTWDHPRGTHALRAAAERAAALPEPLVIEWEAQPLEGFESAPIGELAERYDLLVIDHPHLGDAILSGALQPLDGLLPPAVLRDVQDHSVGLSAASYEAEHRTWALPLDAATQVAAVRPDLLGEPPATWDEVVRCASTHSVALSLAGPHAFLSLCSLMASLGRAPSSLPPLPTGEQLSEDADLLFDRDTALEALDTMREIFRLAPRGSETLNPIGLLERMRTTHDIAYVPLIYGYVNYSASGSVGSLVRFVDAPTARPSGTPVGTIGGTGIAVSSRAKPSPALVEHLCWLLSPEAQESWIPEHSGQPSRSSAWESDRVNSRVANFYRSTRRTIDASWVRPRFPGYTAFQSEASSIVRGGLLQSGADLTQIIDRIESSYQRALVAAAELIQTGARQ